MKLHFKIICIALFAISIASCKKDSTTTPPVKMGATIDGKSWSPDIRLAILSSSVFTISGTSLTGASLVFTIKGETTGTYSLSVLPPKSDCGATYTAVAIPTTSDIYVSVSGTVVLTKVDKTAKLISGTFEFSLANDALALKSITKGQFNDLSYQ